MRQPPTIQVREWSKTTPDTPGIGAALKDLSLTEEDRAMLEGLKGRSTLKITELRQGLAISVGPHIGTINLSNLRLVVMPKMSIEYLMRMVAYAFHLSDLALIEAPTTYQSGERGLIDLLGLALLRAVERIVRGGLLTAYKARSEDLKSPRGRLDMRHIATHPSRMTLRCTYEDLTADHALNQLLASGLRLAAQVVDSPNLRLDLARTADRFFGDLTPEPLGQLELQGALSNLDRRSSHYHTALTLIALIHQGARLQNHARAGSTPLSSFMLNMNVLFERFLSRYLSENAPPNTQILSQDSRSDVFHYLENPGGWTRPSIRPDFVIRQGPQTLAIADAKYKNRHEHPPSTAELYQLTTYGLAYKMPAPGEVLLLHPVTDQDPERRAELRFAPPSTPHHIRIRLVPVPLDRLLDGSLSRWWPLDIKIHQ